MIYMREGIAMDYSCKKEYSSGPEEAAVMQPRQKGKQKKGRHLLPHIESIIHSRRGAHIPQAFTLEALFLNINYLLAYLLFVHVNVFTTLSSFACNCAGLCIFPSIASTIQRDEGRGKRKITFAHARAPINHEVERRSNDGVYTHVNVISYAKRCPTTPAAKQVTK